MKVGQKIRTKILRLGIHGEGVGRFNSFPIFIDGALPGEEVASQVTERKSKYGRGKLLDIITPSPSRVKPPCSLFGKCGGCQLMHLDYPSQLEMKRQRVIDAFERIGKLGSVDVAQCRPSPSLSPRNKIQVAIREGLSIGFNAKGSHDLVEVDFCHIHCELGQTAYAAACQAIKNSKLSAYHWKTGRGLLRHMIIRTAVRTGQVLVILVTNGKGSPELIKVAEEMRSLCPEIKGVVQNINRIPNNVVLGGEYAVLSGQDHIEEEICGFRFKVSSASFFQVNPEQAEALYQTVRDCAGLTGTETVLDAYCGVGTMALILSPNAKKVIGVECIPQAIEDAMGNAKKNGIENASFVCDSAENFIEGVKEIDLLLLNPPRKGCEERLIQQVGKLLPKKVIYVSCDPATLARDLSRLKDFGYQIGKVQPFDMFPQTAHVESLTTLQI